MLTGVGIYYLAKGVGEFRTRVIALKQDYEFSKFSDFKICTVLITLISIFKYCLQKLLIKFCYKIMKKSMREAKTEKDRELREKYKIKYEGPGDEFIDQLKKMQKDAFIKSGIKENEDEKERELIKKIKRKKYNRSVRKK